jgi:hypothetical protein
LGYPFTELALSSERARRLSLIACELLVGSVTVCWLTTFPVMSGDVSTSEFLLHCEAAPEPCKAKVLAYVKFLADGELLDPCIMQLPAGDVAAKLIGWMRDHPEYSGKDWVDCLDDAIAMLKLCKS